MRVHDKLSRYIIKESFSEKRGVNRGVNLRKYWPKSSLSYSTLYGEIPDLLKMSRHDIWWGRIISEMQPLDIRDTPKKLLQYWLE